MDLAENISDSKRHETNERKCDMKEQCPCALPPTHTHKLKQNKGAERTRVDWRDDSAAKSTGSLHRTYLAAPNCLKLQVRGTDALLWPLQVPGTIIDTGKILTHIK